MGYTKDTFNHSSATVAKRAQELHFISSPSSNNPASNGTNPQSLGKEREERSGQQGVKTNAGQGDKRGNTSNVVHNALTINKKVNPEKQSKHIQGNPYYIDGKSIFLGTVADAQRLVEEFAGTGDFVNPYKERVDFGKIIGLCVNPDTNEKTPTRIGIIHYSKNGAHICPQQPFDSEEE